MEPSRRSWSLAATGLVLLLANGCARNEERPRTAPSNPDEVVVEEGPDAVAPREPEASPAEKCIEMAAREDWVAALDPCTRAARDHPEDEAIQQALERAISASEGPVE